MVKHIVPSEEWYALKGQLNDDEPATPEEVEALRDVIEKRTDLLEGARRIMTAREDKKPLDDKTNRVAWLLFDLCMEFPDQQLLVFDLLEAIKQLQDDELDFTEEQKQRFPDWKTWKNMDRFWGLVDEMRRSYWAHRFQLDEDDSDGEECRRNWTRINALLARHFARYGGVAELGYGLYSVRAILERPALEEMGSDDPRWGSEFKFLNMDVQAAAQWLIIAGKRIHDALKDEPQDIGVGNADLWKTSESGTRIWNLWKRRLQLLQGQHALNKDTQQAARAAFEAMTAVEIG